MSETKQSAQDQEGKASTTSASVNGQIEAFAAKLDHRPQPGDPPIDGSNDTGETSA